MPRIVFSFAFFRQKLPVQLVSTATKSRWKFYAQVWRRSFHTAWTRFRHGRPIFAVTHNTAPHANDVVGYGCRSQAVPLTFAPSVAIRSRRSEAFSLQGS